VCYEPILNRLDRVSPHRFLEGVKMPPRAHPRLARSRAQSHRMQVTSQPNAAKTVKSSRRIGWVSLVIALLAAAWLLLPLRVSKPELNQLVALASLEVAFVAAGIACLTLFHRGWARVLGVATFAILTTLYPGILVLSMVGGGPLTGHEVVASVPLKGSRVVAHRLNGGATMDYSIRITHELPILPGIIVARDLHQEPHGREASLTVTEPDLVSVSVNDGKPREFALRRYVLF